MKSLRKSNQGMTLVELLVSVAVLSLLMTGAFALMKQAATYHSNSAREVEIQNQLQTAFTQLSNLMVDATIGIEFDDARGRMLACHEDGFYVAELHGENLYLEQHAYSASADTIDAKLQEARAYIISQNARNLLSDRVATFLVDTSGQDEGYVVLALRCTYHNRTAYMSKNVFLRNSDSGSQILSGGTKSKTLTVQPCPSDPEIYYVDVSSLIGKNVLSFQLTGTVETAQTNAEIYETNVGITSVDMVTKANFTGSAAKRVECMTNAAATVLSAPLSVSGNYLIINMLASANTPNQLIVTYKEPED